MSSSWASRRMFSGARAGVSWLAGASLGRGDGETDDGERGDGARSARRESRDSSQSVWASKTRPKFRETISAICSRVGGCFWLEMDDRAISAAREVTGLSEIPHGTMSLKESRLVVTFRAKPCEVTAREMWTPMAAILAGGLSSVQTPVNPEMRV